MCNTDKEISSLMHLTAEIPIKNKAYKFAPVSSCFRNGIDKEFNACYFLFSIYSLSAYTIDIQAMSYKTNDKFNEYNESS